MSQYQLLPDLTEEEFAALKADIAKRGVQVPVEKDERGNVLDGHHRMRACHELGVTDYPTIIRPGMSEEEKTEHILALNLDRRHLSQEQRARVEAKLRADGWSLRRIAEKLHVSPPTVLRDIEGIVTDETMPDRVQTSDGRSYPARRPAVITHNERATEKALTALSDLDTDKLPAGISDFRRVERIAREVKQQATKQRNEEQAREAATRPLPDRCVLALGDFREQMEDLANESVALVFTDPPYDEATIPLYAQLAEIASRKLIPGGSLIAYAGHYALPAILPGMCEHLRFWWTLGVKHSGPSARLPGKWVFVEWKPLLWFVKGGRRDNQFVADMIVYDAPGGENEHKAFHEWQQDIKPARYYIDLLTQPGELVAEPFLGSGTTVVAALQAGRSAWGCEIDEGTLAIARGRIDGCIA